MFTVCSENACNFHMLSRGLNQGRWGCLSAVNRVIGNQVALKLSWPLYKNPCSPTATPPEWVRVYGADGKLSWHTASTRTITTFDMSPPDALPHYGSTMNHCVCVNQCVGIQLCWAIGKCGIESRLNSGWSGGCSENIQKVSAALSRVHLCKKYGW